MSIYHRAIDESDEATTSRVKHRGRPKWRATEILAMVLGFYYFWPVGAAILALGISRKRENYQGDLLTYAQDKVAELRMRYGFDHGFWRTPEWGGGLGLGSTGNAAFDDWRAGELARLEAERRKLAQAERDFAAHLAKLRRARDREEFDRFMNERRASDKRA